MASIGLDRAREESSRRWGERPRELSDIGEKMGSFFWERWEKRAQTSMFAGKSNFPRWVRLVIFLNAERGTRNAEQAPLPPLSTLIWFDSVRFTFRRAGSDVAMS